MELKTAFRTALILARERIYQGQKEKIGSSKEDKVTDRTLWVTNLSMLPFYVLMSFFLAGAQVGTGLPLGAFSLLLLVQLFMSLFVTLNSISNFRDLDMHEPLLPLPISREHLIVSFSWLLSGGAAILIIPIPGAAIYAVVTGNYLAILVSFLWGVLTVLLGHSLGLILTNFFSFGASGRSTLSKVFRVLKLVGALLLFLLWFFISTQEGFLSPLFKPLTEISESLWFLYPFNASMSIVNFSWIYLLSFAMYGLLFSGIYWLAGIRTWKNIVQPSFATSGGFEGYELELGGKFKSLIRKDLTLSFRSGQRFLGSIIFPLMVLFMNLVDVIGGGAISLLRAELVYLAIAILSGWGITYLYVQEGESAWILSVLPLSRNDLAVQKALSAFCLFPIYAVPAIIFVSIKMGFGVPATFLQMLSAFALALTSCLIVSKSLMGRLPENPTVITQETFGSRLTPFLLIFKSLLLSGWPVLVVVVLFILIKGLTVSLLGSVLLLVVITVGTVLNLGFTIWRYKFFDVFYSEA